MPLFPFAVQVLAFGHFARFSTASMYGPFAYADIFIVLSCVAFLIGGVAFGIGRLALGHALQGVKHALITLLLLAAADSVAVWIAARAMKAAEAG